MTDATLDTPSTRRITVRSLHKASAIVLLTFVFFHLTNHLSGLFGILVYNAVQDTFRVVYRFLPIEILLLLIISMQVVFGVVLLVRSLRRGRPKGFWSWAQVLSGGIFAFFMVEHLYALYMARIKFALETDFYWPASVMSGAPFTYYFIPYYFLGVLAIMTHIGVGMRYWAIDAGRPALGDRLGFGFMIAGAAIGAAIIPMLTGALFPIEMPPEWLNYLRYFLPGYTPNAG